MAPKRLTDAQRKDRLEEFQRRRLEKFNDPKRIEKRAWIKSVVGTDVEKLFELLLAAWETTEVLRKENEDLVNRLNRFEMVAHGLSGTLEPHVKFNIARLSAEWDPKDPVARAFLAALKTGRTLTATRNALKGHAERNSAKAFVQAEWKIHQSAYGGNKSAFSRDYVRRVLNEMGVKVTEKQMREVWLKDPPPASKPDRLPVGR